MQRTMLYSSEDLLDLVGSYLDTESLSSLRCANRALSESTALQWQQLAPFVYHDRLSPGALVLAVDCVNEVLLATVTCKTFYGMHVCFHHYRKQWDEAIVRRAWLTRIPVILTGRDGPWLSVSALLNRGAGRTGSSSPTVFEARWCHRMAEPCHDLLPDSAPQRQWDRPCCTVCACGRRRVILFLWNQQHLLGMAERMRAIVREGPQLVDLLQPTEQAAQAEQPPHPQPPHLQLTAPQDPSTTVTTALALPNG